MFEGEYLNGKKWNGIIKEYYDDSNDIKFDGQYCEGKKKGKEYNINGHLIFEGEYLDEKNWNGTIYNNNGFLFEIKNGNGKVKEYDEYDKLIFEGEYINGIKNGKEYNKDFIVLTFEGEYLNGKKWNGKINEYRKPKPFHPFICGTGRIDYDLLIRKKNIKEKLKEYKDILKYEGEYLNGKRNGNGKEYNRNGELIYEGLYLNGKIHKI